MINMRWWWKLMFLGKLFLIKGQLILGMESYASWAVSYVDIISFTNVKNKSILRSLLLFT